MISVASDARCRHDGEWVNRANWIEHTVFGRRDKMKDWALDTLQAGDLVFIRSTPSQTSWEKDGEKRYGYTMAVTELKLLTAKADLKQRGPADPQAGGFGPSASHAQSRRPSQRTSARAPGLRRSLPRPGRAPAPTPTWAARCAITAGARSVSSSGKAP